MHTPSLRVENLYFAYNGLAALSGVSLTIRPGEFVALVGQNGSGKTTLVKHFNGLLKPTRGKVWVGERDTASCAVSDLAREVGYVFQNPDHQINQPTVREEVAFGLKNLDFPAGEAARRTDEALAAFGLQPFADRPPAILGFGLRRKIALASVCVLRPPVLILDEPTGGLDARSAEELLGFAARLKAEGHTLILVSHDMRRVAAFAERCVVLKEGRVWLDGPARAVFAKTELLQQAFLAPPPVTRLAQALAPQVDLDTPLTPEEFYSHYRACVA
ncbi:MAG TPA: ABC transporter ATP-binding protein [Anaerolineales bacterium]|nr:ABC transporter ATP-binding protein [Anaerolineales bacterium]